MPIYEYYCPACDGRYRHLARHIDEEAPPCPRCHNPAVERLVSTANLVHQDAYYERKLKKEAGHVNADNIQEISNFLDESGRLDDASGVYGSEAYRELIYRRKQGAADADLQDLVDDLTAEMNASQGTDLASAVVFSDDVDNRMGAEGPPEHHEHPDRPDSRKSAEDLGWA